MLTSLIKKTLPRSQRQARHLTPIVAHLNARVEPETTGGGELVRCVSQQKHASAKSSSFSPLPLPLSVPASGSGNALEVLVCHEGVHRPRANGTDFDIQGEAVWAESVPDQRERSFWGKPLRKSTQSTVAGFGRGRGNG